MGVKERYEKYQKSKKETDENKSNLGVAERYNLNTFTHSLPEKLKEIEASSKGLYGDYTTRFVDKDGNFIYSYRGDTKDTLTNFETSKTKLDNDTKAILDGLTKYEKYFDADFVKATREYLTGNSNNLSGMYDTYKADHDYYSQWANEDAYNYWEQTEKEKEKYAAMTDEELEAAKKDSEGQSFGDKVTNWINYLPDALKAVVEKDSEAGKLILERNVDNIISKAGGLAEDLGIGNGKELAETFTLFGDELASALGVDYGGRYTPEEAHNYNNYDVSLVYQEILNRKYAEIDTSPEEVNALIERYTELERQNEQDTLSGAVDRFSSGLAGGVSSYVENKSIDNEMAEIKTKLDSLCPDWEVLVSYNRIRRDEEANQAFKEGLRQSAEEHPVLTSLSTVALSPAKALGLIGMVDNAFDDTDLPTNPNSPYFMFNNMVDVPREEVMGNYDWIDDNGRDWFDTVYGVGMSTADSLFTTAITGGSSWGGGAVLGMSAASDTAQQIALQGGTKEQALVTGLFAGINEMVWEKISIGNFKSMTEKGIRNLFSVDGVKTAVANMFKSAGVNFTEEAATEAANLIVDYFVNGGLSTYAQMYEYYLRAGYDDATAREKARNDMLKQVGEAGFNGALQGVFMSSVSTGLSGTSNAIDAIGNKISENQHYNQQGKNIVANKGVQDLIDDANGIPALKKLADKVAGVKTDDFTTARDGRKYEKQVGKLYKGVQEAQFKNISKATETAFKSVIKAELEASGVENADKVADVLTKAMYGGGLTQAESKIVESVDGTNILSKALNSAEFSEKLSAEQKAQLTNNIEKYVDTYNLPDSYNGEVIVDATDEKVDSMVITSLDGKDITLDVKTGDEHQIVKSGELRLNNDYKVVFEGLMDIKNEFGLDELTANKMLTLWEGYKGSAKEFIKGIESSFMYGQYNMRFDFDKSEVVKNLPEHTRNQVYEMGREYKQKVTEEKAAHVKNNATTEATGKVTYADGLTYEQLNKSQKAQVAYASIIAEEYGYDLEVFRSPKNARGQSIGESGSYTMGKTKMRLDIDAGTIDGESLLVFTLSHELDHYILDWSPAKHKIFADYLVETYGKKGVSVDALVKNRIAESVVAAERDKTRIRKALSYEDAFNEVVANACEDFLKDPNLRQRILEVENIDKKLGQKIKDFLKNIVAKLDKVLKRLQGQSIEAAYVREFDVDALEKLKDLWVDALKDSRENVLQARKNDAKSQKNTTDEGDVKHKIRTDFYTQLDNWDGKTIGFSFVVGTTSEALISAGIPNKQIRWDASKVKTTLKDHTGMSLEVIRQVPELLEHPIVVIDSKRDTDSRIIMGELYDDNGKIVTVVLKLNPSSKKGNELDLIKISSSQGRSHIESLFKNADDTFVKVRFVDKKRIQSWLNVNRLQLPLHSFNLDSNNNIHNPTENVNTGDENQTIAGIDYDALNSAKNENGKELFQYRAIQHDVPEYRALLEKYSDMSKVQIDSLFVTMDKAFAIIEDNLEILDYAWDENLNEDGTWDDTVDARAFNPVKPNSDKLYKYSLDFSTLCRKRLLQQVIAEELSLALDRAVTKAEGIAIRNELIKLQEEGRQIEIACALCYVESARMKSPEQIQKFLNNAGQWVREFFANKAKSGIAEAEEKARKSVAKKYAKEIKEGAVSPTDTYTTKKGKVKYTPLSKLPKKMADEIRKAKGDARSSYSPSAEEQRIIDTASNLPVTAFTTADGLKNLAKDNPVIFDAYTSFVRNATHSKGTEKDVWYRVGDANKIGDDLIAAMNKENGLRSQSWSDFQVIHLLDYVGAIIELSTKNAKMQSYTKVPDYVNLMGLTGQMINLSLIPARDFNGKLEFDPVEGMAFKVARELRDKYPDTTGTISIGITNEQIQMLLESMDIDYVIPYHHSAMSKVVRKEMHIPSWISYQEFQGEKKITSKKDALANAKKHGVQLLSTSDADYHNAPTFSEWFDFEEARQVAQLENLNPTDPKTQKKYGVMYGGYKAMQNAADNYLRLCAERGLVPKFCHEKADFTTEENYWKLLIDRKMINQKTGEIIEQKPVQPFFNEGEVLNILNNEVARYEGVKEDFDYATRIVTEKFLNGEMNESISKIAKSIGDTVTNVTKVAILNSDVQGKTYLQDRDSTGRELTPEQVEFFKDSKVRDEDGNLLKVYHGTEAEFTVFDKTKGRSTMDIQGSFFSPWELDAKGYGQNVKAYYLNITNPASEGVAYRALNKFKGQNNAGVKAREYLESLGYDGVNNGDEEYIAFNSNQIKKTDNLKPTKNEDIRYQDRATPEQDAEYLELAKNPEKNEARLREMVDSVASANGYTIKAYHATNAEFNSFDIDKTSDINYHGKGIYFTNSTRDVENNYENYEGPDPWNKIDARAYELADEKYGISYEDTLTGDVDVIDKLNECYDEAIDEFKSTIHRVTAYLKFDNPIILKKGESSDYEYDMSKHDGIIDEQVYENIGHSGMDENTIHYVVRNPRNIKSAELVTYDDNGNIIPLSERFNEGNEDIRYQDRVYNGSLTQERIDDLIHDSGAGSRVDYANMWIASINPSDFIDLTLRFETRNKGRDVFDAEVGGDYGGVMGDRDYIADLKNSRMPYLRVDIDTGKVIGHDGRHRMRALEKTGASRTPIGIIFEKDGRVYKGNDNGVRLETIDIQRLTSQFDDKFYSQYNAYIHDIIPLNEDHRAEIEKTYRARSFEVKQGWTVAFQDRPMTDREILVDAMSNSEELSIEDKNRLEIYRKKIDNITELEQELAGVGKQIHKIITTKGSDRKQLASLNEKANTLRKKISRLDGELLRIEAMKPMKNLVEIRKKQVLKAYKQKTQEQRHRNVEGRNKTATKNKIKKVVRTLESLYGNPTKEKNVKIEFQDMVKKALIMADVIFDSGNISAYDILSGNVTTRLSEKDKKNLDEWRKFKKIKEGYQQRLNELESSEKVNSKTHEELLKMISECDKKLNALSRKLADVVERQKGELNDTAVQDAIDSLVEAYKSLESAGEYAAVYNDYVAKRLDTLKKSLKDATVKTMTLTQLEEVYQAYKMVLTTVRTANELFVNNKKMSVIDMGEKVVAEIKKVAKVTDDKTAMFKHIRKFVWEELKPIYAFERIGSSTLMELFKDARKGEDVFARDIYESKSFFLEKCKDYGYDSWNFDDRKDFVLPDGRVFSLKLEEIMSIYAYSKRDQAVPHMTEGGFVFDSKEFFTDNKKKGLKIKKERTTVKAYRLNNDVFFKIINSLTNEQRKFVDDMQDYLSSVMGAKGNEISRMLYGIDLFKEKAYFTLISSEDFMAQANEPAKTATLKNAGMTKPLTPHARNPIVLKGFMDVWSEHVGKMSTYHAFVLPIENLNKVHSYTGYARGEDSESVKTILAGAFGHEVNEYITTFITDLNGGVKVQSSGSFAMGLINKFKKTAVSASSSVVVQQPTAIIRAMAMLDPKYFVHENDGLKHNEAWEELKKYAPVALIKEIGGFDIGGGRQTAEYITAKEYKGFDKVKGFFTDGAYRDEALMWGASKADEISWVYIWNSVKKEIADTTTHKVGSEEFLNACGERFTEIIAYTQVYDSVFSRSGWMRNKGEIAKMSTSFMGEPTTSFNMLYNAILQAKRGNIRKGNATRVIGATMSSILLAAVAKSFIYALRDDDEDESYVEKYVQALTNSFMEDLFIPNMLPFVSDITSLLSGWDVERTDMAIIKDVVDAFDGLDSSSKSGYRKVEDLAGAIAALFGLPVKNVMRTAREIYNLFANILDDNGANGDVVVDAAVSTVTGGTSASDVNALLEKGKTDKANKLINELVAEKVKQGKTEKEAKASIKSSITSYWKGLYLQAYRDKDNAEMLRIRRILQSTGLYDDVVGTCSNWIKGMKDEEDTKYKKW